jgi:hypothetical protein
MTVLSYSDADSRFARALDGLCINPNQSFGIEFELVSRTVDCQDETKWRRVAKALVAELTSVFGAAAVNQTPVRRNPKSVSYRVWNVVWDASCGWEIVTPVLRGQPGFETVVRALDALTDSNTFDLFDLRVSRQTGTHVHFGWHYRDTTKFRTVLQFMRKYEAAFFTLVSASRYGEDYSPNEYCKPLRLEFDDDDVACFRKLDDIENYISDHHARYLALNVAHVASNPQRIEVRMHSGTLNSQKILTWVALWMNVFHAIDHLGLNVSRFRSDAEMPGIEKNIHCDIISVAVRLLGLNQPKHRRMLEILHQRRSAVFGNPSWAEVVGEYQQEELLKYWDRRFEKIVGTSNRVTFCRASSR